MGKHEPPRLPNSDSLPRPTVLRPEDLANVAAGVALTVMPSALTKVIIAGGLPATSVLQQSRLVSG